MSATIPFKRLILRAVLRDVGPMVARLISVNEDTELSDLHDVFQQALGWGGDLGYSFRIHGKEVNSFRRRTRSLRTARAPRYSARPRDDTSTTREKAFAKIRSRVEGTALAEEIITGK